MTAEHGRREDSWYGLVQANFTVILIKYGVKLLLYRERLEDVTTMKILVLHATYILNIL